MPRLAEKCDSREVRSRGEHVALAGNQCSSKSGIEKVFLRQLPGHDLAYLRPGLARCICQHPAGRVLPGNNRFRRRATYHESLHVDIAIFRLAGIALSVEARYEAILDLMSIREDVALVELKNIGEVVHAGYKAVYGARLDDVLPLSPQEFLVEDALQRGWPQFHGRLQSLAVYGIVHGQPWIFPFFSNQPFRVIGFMQRQFGTQRPSSE